MKANKAPEKLYLSKNIYSTFLYQVPDPDDDTAVEYTRTDAFIEKMKAWLMDNSANYMMYDPLTSSACLEVEKMIDNFEKYMRQ